ncbi:MAG TPA: alpha-L-fucosidase [Oscillospiraceae bacterium]|nr:alpha-L-fucosidase [Oscillospiraceae bacterium]
MMFEKPMTLAEYNAAVAATREKRMAWWNAARFGMFVHFGPYSVAGRHEWIMALDGYTVPEYEEKIASKFHPKKGCAREWAKLAYEAGCKYMVLTTRHHDGYSLWDSDVNPYNVVKFGHNHDVVAEYVAACREFGLGIGFYHSVMDWHNPDGSAAAYDMAARMRFIEYHRGMLNELLTRYGKIDILWYDVHEPFGGTDMDFVETNRVVRNLQPDIIINPRSGLAEDMDTPEDKIEESEKYWESCMTFNGLSWGYVDSEQAAPYSYNANRIIRMLNDACSGRGNLLLNIGPAPDGSIPTETIEPMRTVGKWLKQNGDAVYGAQTGATAINLQCASTYWVSGGRSSVRDKSLFLWYYIWTVTGELRVAGILTKVKKVRCLADGKEYPFVQDGVKLTISGLPTNPPDQILGVNVLEVVCEKPPKLMIAPMLTPMSRLSKPPEIE